MSVIDSRPAARQGSSTLAPVAYNGGPVRLDVGRADLPARLRPAFTEQTPLVLLKGALSDLAADLREAFERFAREFDNLPVDRYLHDGADFRRRRFGRFRFDSHNPAAEPELMVDNAFFQDAAINRYAGGTKRVFEPLTEEMRTNKVLLGLMKYQFALLPEDEVAKHRYWEAGLHPTRIVGTADKPGYPAPEGLHQDGHVFAVITLIGRRNVDGGTSVFADHEHHEFWRGDLAAPLDTAMWVDRYCWHDVTEVVPRDAGAPAIRDIVGISWNPAREL